MMTQTIKIIDNDNQTDGSSALRGIGVRGGRGGRGGRTNYRGNRQWNYESNKKNKKIYE